MNRELYRELWAMRFNKMLGLERHSVEDYKHLLTECRRQHRSHSIEPHLEQLIRDEARHVGLVQELLDILARQR